MLAVIVSAMLTITQPAVSMSLTDAQTVAAGYWGPPPCGQPTYEITADEARYPAPVIPGTINVAAANPATCHVILKPLVVTWDVTCIVVMHEYGHLMGHGHAPDPTNIMHAIPPYSWGPCPPPDTTPASVITTAVAPSVRKKVKKVVRKAIRRSWCTGSRCAF